MSEQSLHAPQFFLYRHLCGILAALAMLLLPGMALPQAENLKVDVEAGFAGDYRAGKWVPVFVTISNQPPSGKSINDVDDFKGQIALSTQPSGSREPVQFVRAVEVPKASSKRFVLYAKFPQDLGVGRAPSLRLNTANGKYLAQYQLNVQSVQSERMLVARVTSGSQQISLPPIRDQYVDTLRYGGLNVDLLTDHWAAYDSADIVLFSAWPAKSLRPEVVEALRQWVAMGGTLVFATGRETQTYADEISRTLLPVTLNGTKRLEEQNGKFNIVPDSSGDLASGGKFYVVADSTPKPEAEVLLRTDGVPMIVRQRIGNGQVVMFANDMQSDSRAMEHFLMPTWQSIAPVPSLASAEASFAKTLDNFQTLTGRAARPPNQFLIILVCVIYTLVVGPINFAILGRKKKLELAWITVPVIVLVFFFFIYGVGRLTKGQNDIIREVKIDRYSNGSRIGESTTIVGTFVSNPAKHYFRPAREHYALGDSYSWSTRKEWFLPSFIMGGVSSVGAASPSPVVTFDAQGGRLYVTSLQMGTYDAQNFVIRGPAEESGTGINADLVWEDGSLRGTLTNGSEEDFADSWISVGNSLMPIGAIRKGEVKTISDRYVLGEYSRENKSPVGSRRSFSDAPGHFASLRKDAPSTNAEVNESNLGLLMQASYRPEYTGMLFPPASGDILFIGVHSSEKVTEEITSLRPTIQSAVGATIVRLDPKPAKGQRFWVPDTFMKKRLVLLTYEREGRGTVEMEDDNSVVLSDGGIVVCYELPFADPRLKVTSFRAQPVLTASPTQDATFEVLHWGGAMPRWEVADPTVDILNSDVAMPGTGRMYIRVKSVTKQDQKQLFTSERTKLKGINVSMVGVIEK